MSLTPQKRSAIKHLINTSSPFSTSSPIWSLVNEGVTELTESFNPDTEDLQYIDEEQKTTTVKSYAPSLSLSCVMVSGDPVNTWIRDKIYELPTGEKADCEYIRFNILDEIPGNPNVYKAIKKQAVVSIDSTGGSAGDTAEMSVNINGKGDPIKGEIDYSDPKNPIFTAGDSSTNKSIEFTVKSANTAVPDASVTFNNVTKTTGTDGKAKFQVNTLGTYEYSIAKEGLTGIISNITIDSESDSEIKKEVSLSASTSVASMDEYSLR